MSRSHRLIISTVIASLLVGSIFLFTLWQEHRERERFRPLAECLTEKGVKLYGLFWNEQTIRQRELFGVGAELLPYTECSSEDGQRILDECRTARISVFPLWKFRAGDEQTGTLSIEAIADKTGCPLP